jgi:NADH dehydrogenase FAD-containing subunit
MKIVILGGGYAGVFAAANLCKHVGIPLNFMSYATTRTIRFKKEIW